ncbi:MAG: AzlD domain-containing protein [Kiritimatiellia bacterium]
MPDWCDRKTLLGLIAVTAAVTYLLRVVPLVLLRRPLRNPHLVALLEYVPYALLSAMIFPDVFYATDPAAAFPGRVPLPALAGAVTAIVLAFFRFSLPLVACVATCAACAAFLVFG